MFYENKNGRQTKNTPPPPGAETGIHRPKFYQTLSWKLVIVFLGLLGAVILGIIALVGVTLRTYMIDEVDKSLTSSGKLLASQTVNQFINGSQTQVLPSEFYFYLDLNDSKAIEVIKPQVSEIYGTPRHPRLLARKIEGTPHTVTGTKPEVPWRVITVQLVSQISGLHLGTAVIAHPLISVSTTTANVVRVMTVLSLVIVVVGAIIAFALVQLSLRRLRDIEQVTHTVAAGDLSVRVPHCGSDDSEIGMLGDSINEMLKTIEASFEAKKLSEKHMRRFVSDASHELRTPLATVRGYAELYRLGGVPENRTAHAFARIESEASRMASLVEDLLQLARLDEGRQLKFTQVELVSTAMNAVADFLIRAPDRHANVIPLDGEELLPIVFNADHDRITQLITNLLSNVLTHTPEKTPVEVAVGINPENAGEAVIEVRDHGPGIRPEDRERIFERFFRTDSSRSRDSGGSGLGLAIVAAITAAHGGTATVKDTPGGGLTVRLVFPSVLKCATAKARERSVSEGHLPSELPSELQATIISQNYEVSTKNESGAAGSASDGSPGGSGVSPDASSVSSPNPVSSPKQGEPC